MSACAEDEKNPRNWVKSPSKRNKENQEGRFVNLSKWEWDERKYPIGVLSRLSTNEYKDVGDWSI